MNLSFSFRGIEADGLLTSGGRWWSVVASGGQWWLVVVSGG